MNLRRVGIEDLEFLGSIRNDDLVSSFSRRGRLTSEEIRQTFLVENQTYVVVWEESEIGYVAFRDLDELCEISLALGSDWRGRGLSTEVLTVATRHAIDVLEKQAVLAEVFATNEVSRRIFEKVGYLRTGSRKSGRGTVFQYRYE